MALVSCEDVTHRKRAIRHHGAQHKQDRGRSRERAGVFDDKAQETKPRKREAELKGDYLKKEKRRINNIVVISDTHCGCRVGLCPPEGATLDDGGRYMPSKLQLKMWSYWREFWDKWVPEACHHEPFILVHNGDIVDGVHHNSTTQISHNLEDQAEIAYNCLAPIVDRAAAYYQIRGTEAHVGNSAVDEERLAKRLGAKRNQQGQYARYDLWLKLGDRLIHFLHHIGTGGSSAYEATAIGKEMVESFVEAARWKEQPPDVTVRSHRHRNYEVRMPTANGYGISVVTPAWQLKTAYAFKIAGARLSPPQLGGIVIRFGDQDLYTRHRVWTIGRSQAEII